VSTTSLIGCGRTDHNLILLIRRRRSSCGTRPVGVSTDFQPLHRQSARRPSPRCPPCATWASSSTQTSDLVMRTHVCRTVSSCFAALRQLRSIRHLVSATVFQSLVAALVLCRLDYGNGTLVVLPAYLVRRLQSVQNAAARLVFRLRRSDHITDALVSLHWLRVPERITFKVAGAPCWPIGLYMAMPRSTCDSSHRSPTSRLDKDCGLQLPTSYVFLLLDCLLLDIAPSLSPMLAYGTTYRLMSPQHHLCSSSEND